MAYNASPVIQQLISEGLLPLLRVSPAELFSAAEALRAAGYRLLAFALDRPELVAVFSRFPSRDGSGLYLGAEARGAESAREAVRAGARFLVARTLDPSLVQVGREAGVPVIPGVLTPTELSHAQNLGAEAVHVFPASALGPAYVAALHRAVPDVPLVVSGGLSPKQVGPLFEAGAAAVLVEEELGPERGQADILAELQGFAEAIRRARDRRGRGWWGRWAAQPIKPTEGPDK